MSFSLLTLVNSSTLQNPWRFLSDTKHHYICSHASAPHCLHTIFTIPGKAGLYMCLVPMAPITLLSLHSTILLFTLSIYSSFFSIYWEIFFPHQYPNVLCLVTIRKINKSLWNEWMNETISGAFKICFVNK